MIEMRMDAFLLRHMVDCSNRRVAAQYAVDCTLLMKHDKRC